MTIATQATITNEDGWKRTAQVVVSASDVDQAIDTATERFRREAKIEGFRPGKAPLSLVAQRFAADIRQAVLEQLVPEAYEQALRQLELMPLGSPALSQVKFERGAEMTFQFEVEIRPQVEITGYRGLKLEKKVYEITDRDVDLAIESLREGAAKTVEVNRPAREGDVVICDLQRIHDRRNSIKKSKFENVRFDLREDRTRPEFFKGIVGMTVGEGREMEVTYSATESDPDLADNTVLFRTWLKSVSEKKLPPLDDEFAKSVGDFQSVDDLRQRVSASLTRRAESNSLKEMGEQARRQVIEANAFDVPQGLLNEYLERVTRRIQEANPDVTAEAIRVQFAPAAIEQFRWDYVVSEIAAKENVTVDENEVREVQATWPEDSTDRPSEEKIHESLLESKVYRFLIENADVTEVPRVLNPKIITPSSGESG